MSELDDALAREIADIAENEEVDLVSTQQKNVKSIARLTDDIHRLKETMQPELHDANAFTIRMAEQDRLELYRLIRQIGHASPVNFREKLAAIFQEQGKTLSPIQEKESICELRGLVFDAVEAVMRKKQLDPDDFPEGSPEFIRRSDILIAATEKLERTLGIENA